MRPIFIILILALVALQYKLWFGDTGVRHWKRLENEIAQHTEENEKSLLRNQVLEADIEELKQGDQALEEQARHELGMVKEGEKYYQFMDNKP